MPSCEKAQHRAVEEQNSARQEIRRWYDARWVRATARLAGFGAVITAAVICTATPLSGPPSATANTTPTATVSGVADPESGADFLKSLSGPYSSMGSALTNMGNAIKAQDWDGVHGTCQDLRGSGQQLKAKLPSPDSRVTPEIQAAVDDINSASDICAGFGPQTQQSDFNQMMSFINDARSHITHVKTILTGRS